MVCSGCMNESWREGFGQFGSSRREFGVLNGRMKRDLTVSLLD